MKKIIVIMIILTSLIIIRSLMSGVITNLWQQVSVIKGMNINGLLSDRFVAKQTNVAVMFYMFILLPFLFIRCIRINFNVSEKLFNKEILFNICYVILVIILELFWSLSYIYNGFLIIYAITFCFVVFGFKILNRYIYNLYE